MNFSCFMLAKLFLKKEKQFNTEFKTTTTSKIVYTHKTLDSHKLLSVINLTSRAGANQVWKGLNLQLWTHLLKELDSPILEINVLFCLGYLS